MTTTSTNAAAPSTNDLMTVQLAEILRTEIATRYQVIEYLCEFIAIFNQLSTHDQIRFVDELAHYLDLNAQETHMMRIQGGANLVCAIVGGVLGGASGMFAKTPAGAPAAAAANPRLNTHGAAQDLFKSFIGKFDKKFLHSLCKTAGTALPQIGQAANTLIGANVSSLGSHKTLCERASITRLQDAEHSARQAIDQAERTATKLIELSNRRNTT